jgi:hypothetical protein
MKKFSEYLIENDTPEDKTIDGEINPRDGGKTTLILFGAKNMPLDISNIKKAFTNQRYSQEFISLSEYIPKKPTKKNEFGFYKEVLLKDVYSGKKRKLYLVYLNYQKIEVIHIFEKQNEALYWFNNKSSK